MLKRIFISLFLISIFATGCSNSTVKYENAEQYSLAMDKIRENKSSYDIVGYYSDAKGKKGNFQIQKKGKDLQAILKSGNETLNSSLKGENLTIQGKIFGMSINKKVGKEECLASKFNMFAAANFIPLTMIYWDRNFNTGAIDSEFVKNLSLSDSVISKNGIPCRMLTDKTNSGSELCVSDTYGIAIYMHNGSMEINVTQVK